jgi:hypothetical protein
LQNGLLPSREILHRAIYGEVADIRGRFGFLKHLSPDITKLLTGEKITETEFLKEMI